VRRLLLVPLLLIASTALASPADSVRSRIAGLRELGAAFKAIGDGLRASEPQTILIQQSARQVRNAASQMPGWFPAGSGAQAGVKTAAKPEIWSQPARFRASMDAFAAASGRFQAAVASGNQAALRTEFRNLGATCKGCHDSFRVPST
jgi:cytochrome c556